MHHMVLECLAVHLVDYKPYMKRLFAALPLLLSFCVLASAQKLDYDVNFTYLFDNFEFAPSSDAWEKSCTINAARLTPQLGFRFDGKDGCTHSLMVGLDVMKNMGEQLPTSELFHEALFYYNAVLNTSKGVFEGSLGTFSKAFSEAHYSDLFFSDRSRFYDNNYEGLMMKWRSDRLYAELGCDWMGMYGVTRRERFQILTAGEWKFSKLLSLGWDAVFYHYAGSVATPGVVDNSMVNPYLKLDFATVTGMQKLFVSAGPVLSYQRDRVLDGPVRSPGGIEATISAAKWNLGIQNTTYVGDDLMIYYNQYGSELYSGSALYHTKEDNTSSYDKLELYWQPRISDFVSLRLSSVFHFGMYLPEVYLGSQQAFTLIFSLDALRRFNGAKEGVKKSFGEYFKL